jgi:leader peptidase (prepilin peptidase) / N-methyltransferase
MNQNNKLYGSFPVSLFKVIMKGMVPALNTTTVTVLYIAILLLIMVIDLRRRRILNIIALPATGLALLLSLAQGWRSFYLTILGALIGFLFFYLLFLLGKRLYGAGALGFGDVKLALLLGAMLGFHYIIFTLALGILMAGVTALILMSGRQRFHRWNTLPYGVFLAWAGIMVLVWTKI